MPPAAPATYRRRMTTYAVLVAALFAASVEDPAADPAAVPPPIEAPAPIDAAAAPDDHTDAVLVRTGAVGGAALGAGMLGAAVAVPLGIYADAQMLAPTDVVTTVLVAVLVVAPGLSAAIASVVVDVVRGDEVDRFRMLPIGLAAGVGAAIGTFIAIGATALLLSSQDVAFPACTVDCELELVLVATSVVAVGAGVGGALGAVAASTTWAAFE